MTDKDRRVFCEAVYRQFHKPNYISPDPLELVLGHESVADREIVGFIVSSLALGRVGEILGAARWVTELLERPSENLASMTRGEIREMCGPFRYRFFNGDQLAGLLVALKSVFEDYGSLESCFAAGLLKRPETSDPGEPALRGLDHLVREIVARAAGLLDGSILVARPERGSACKRLLLFLRWMVRSDSIDPGGWTIISPTDLLVPVDTHMLSVCRAMGLTSAAQASRAVALELTRVFRRINGRDPVRYDFSLTRLGIHPDGRISGLWPGLHETTEVSRPA